MSVRLYAMTCGWLTMPLHMFLDGEEGEIRLPVPAYLKERRQKYLEERKEEYLGPGGVM